MSSPKEVVERQLLRGRNQGFLTMIGRTSVFSRITLDLTPFLAIILKEHSELQEVLWRSSFRLLAHPVLFCILQHNKVTGKEGFRPKAEVLIALKQMTFGTAGITFTDYFQMSDTIARNSMKELLQHHLFISRVMGQVPSTNKVKCHTPQ